MNKLWPHVQHYDADVGAYLDQTKPMGVKWLECPRDQMQKVKDRGGVNIVRIPTLSGRLDVFEVCAAIESMSVQYGSLVDFYELVNEPDVSTLAAWTALRDFSLACVHRLSQRVIVGNISEGNLPTTAAWWSLWETLLQELMAKGGALGTHEYGAPTMKACTPWHTLRYRLAWNVLPQSVKNVPIYITECGIDGGVTGGKGGYQSFGGEDVFVPDLQWYASEIDQDNGNGRPNVVGATIFLLGHYDPWASFDILGASKILAMLAGETGPAPEVTPMATEFSVGEGVRNEMAKRGDAPLTDEHYVGNAFSITQGGQGVYLYFPQSNSVTFLPKG